MITNFYNAMMDGSLLKAMKESNTETTLLDKVTDTLGNEVHIVLDVCTAQDGQLLDRSIMAVYTDGTLYPAEADKIVLSAVHAAAKKIKEDKK